MAPSPSFLNELSERLTKAGVFRYGIASVEGGVDAGSVSQYEEWIASGRHAGMNYLEKYAALRREPQLLLPGAKSLISCAFSYFTPLPRSPLLWARYALGDDYHDVIRRRLSKVAEWLSLNLGCECRICVDTAPLRERYWAQKSGLGFIGLNNQLIIPGCGSRFLLGEILIGAELPSDKACSMSCGECRQCIENCPGRALDGKGGMDARECLSYLTIEHKGDIPGNLRLGRRIYGCDVCQDVCPHNASSPLTEIGEFSPREEILALTREDILRLSPQDYARIFRNSAVKRTRLAGLQRNARHFDGEGMD